MTTSIPALLEPIQARAGAESGCSSDPCGSKVCKAQRDRARLLAAVKAVAEMHNPVRIYENDEYGHAQTEDESKYVRSICEVCSDSSVTENLDDGNYDLAGEYGEVGWPCPTVSAVEAALRSEA